MPLRIALAAALLLSAAPAFACPFATKTSDAGPMTPVTTAQIPAPPATTTQQ